jgi:hypothetical protein
VRILNRQGSGQRLGGAKVTIGDQDCGNLPKNNSGGEWYDVKCDAGVVAGDRVRVTST